MAGRQSSGPPEGGHKEARETGGLGASIADREGKLAWILGSSRSGSTWMLRMLADLPTVVGLDDPHLGHHLGVWRPIALAWSQRDRIPDLDILPEVKREKPDYFFSDEYRHVWEPALRRMVAERFDAQARDRARERGIADPFVVVKEPGSHAADIIMSLFPGAGLIFLLRDGRDVVDSWLDAYKAGSWALEEGAYSVGSQDRMAFIRWQSSVWAYRTEVVQRVYDEHPPGRRLLLRYEEVRQDPAMALERICERFGVEASRRQLSDVAQRHAFVRAPGQEKGPGKAMRFAEPGRWRLNMNRDEVDAMLEIMGPKLRELGYLSRQPVGARGPVSR
jgi:Sulfotransferase family